jgi:hypothetical protein
MILADILLTLGASTWTAPSTPGWRHFEGPLGNHTFAVAPGLTTYRITAGCLPGGGTVTLDRVTITGDRPCTSSVPASLQTQTDTSLVIQGPITIPPRGSFVLDVATDGHTSWEFYSRAFTADRVTFGELQLPIPQHHDAAHTIRSQWLTLIGLGTAYPATVPVWGGGTSTIGGEEASGMVGPYFVLGEKIANTGGFNGVNLLTMTPDFGTVLLRARGNRNRHPCDVIDPATGEPAYTPPWPGEDYAGLGFTSKACTLPPFTEPLAGSADTSKVQPKRWRGAASSYEPELMGQRITVGTWVSWEGGFSGHDLQHLVRILAPLKAAVDLCGDPCSVFDLRMIANDVAMATDGLPMAVPGAGSTYFGTRSSAWAALALIAAGQPEAITARIQAAQMANGCTANFPYADYWGFNPSPWLPGEAVPVPLPSTIHVAQGMENEFAELARYAAGRGSTRYLDNVYLAGGMLERYRSPVRRLGFRPKWLGVAEDVPPSGSALGVTNLHRRVVQWAGNADFGPWVYLGAGACYAQTHKLDAEPWFAAMLLVGVDGHTGRAPDHATLLQWMRTSYQLRSVAPSVIAALERREP